jgi:hypothetical protein
VCGLLALLFATALPASALAGDVQLIEQKIKAGLIYNFLKYTQWPATAATAATTVCQFGGDAFDGHLAPMAGRTVNQSAIEIRVALTANDAAGCSLLFLPADKKATWSDLKKALAGKAVLTVSDFGDFTAAGGMIEFTRDDDRIGVRINVDAVAAAHLTVEDRLLKLASAVHASPER